MLNSFGPCLFWRKVTEGAQLAVTVFLFFRALEQLFPISSSEWAVGALDLQKVCQN